MAFVTSAPSFIEVDEVPMPPQRLATPLASPSTLRLAQRRAACIGRFDVHGEGGPGRREVEAFVQAIYREHYGASIRHWAPTLVGLWQRGTLVAAAGYRRATDALFLERYLAAPVDESIGAKTGIAATRESICEVGHFASARAGAGRALMLALGQHLAGIGCRWVVSTATLELRLLLDRMGLRVVELGQAHAHVLGDEAASWGSYYDHAPLVIAGELGPSLSALRRSA